MRHRPRDAGSAGGGSGPQAATDAAAGNDPLPVLVLAGGTPKPNQPLWEACRGAPKALLELGGRPMIQWVLDALAEAPSLGPVVVVGLDCPVDLRYAKGLERVEGQGSLVDNLYAGIERIVERHPRAGRAAFCWSDVPLVRAAMLERFLAPAETLDADVVTGLVRRELLEGAFPQVDEKWLRLSGAEWVTADFGLFRPAAAEGVRQDLAELAPHRKSALEQAWRVGFGLLLRYFLRRLSIEDLERRLECQYGVRARILEALDPEMALDVDGPVNLEICRRRLAST